MALEAHVHHGQVIAKGLNLRPAPSTSNTPLTVLAQGTRFEVLSEVSGWYRVSTQGREGFISANPSYVQSVHTIEADLVVVPTPYPTSKPVLLHPRAARAFSAALVHPGLTTDDVKALCRVPSSFRSWESQEALIRKYETAIGSKWTAWNNLTNTQRTAARAAGFAYHPGFPVDAAYTHVGGGALDIQPGLSTAAVFALETNGLRRDTSGDAVHWGWHGG